LGTTVRVPGLEFYFLGAKSVKIGEKDKCSKSDIESYKER
jgi:hypothetical protein